MKTLLITISLFIAISSCAKKEKEDSTDTTSNSLFVAVGTSGTILLIQSHGIQGPLVQQIN